MDIPIALSGNQGKVPEVRLHTYWYMLRVMWRLNTVLVYVDSAAGLQYSKNRGNPPNSGDPSSLIN